MNGIIAYGNNFVLADSDTIKLFDEGSGAVQEEFKVDKMGAKVAVVIPSGSSKSAFYVTELLASKVDSKMHKMYMLIYRHQSSEFIVNNSIYGTKAVISANGKKYVVETNESVELTPGTYTISLPEPDTLKAPKSVTVTLKDGESKSITLNYLKKYEVKLTVGNPVFRVNGNLKNLDSPPVIIPK